MAHAQSRLWVFAAFGLGLFACEVPQYRIDVLDIPEGTVNLEVAAYAQNEIAADHPTFAVTGPRDSYTFGLDLPAVPEGQANISVAARRADGCLLAVGTLAALLPESDGSLIPLPLSAPQSAVETDVCTAAPPVILAVTRHQDGPLQSISYSLLIAGWGFQPTATVTIASTASVQCATGSACNSVCPTTCSGTGMGMGGLPGSGTCLTDCRVTADDAELVRRGPGLIEVDLDPQKNVLQEGAAPGSGAQFVQPIDLLQLLSQPLRITVKNPDQAATTFTEVAMDRVQN